MENDIEQENKRIWMMVYASVASRPYMSSGDSKSWADTAVEDFNDRFNQKK